MAVEQGEDLFRRFRIYSVENPKQARAEFLDSFEPPSDQWISFMQLAGKPGEGRLRQFIAVALTGHAKLEGARTVLAEWLRSETDEFARRALSSALAEPRVTSRRPQRERPPSIAELYSYVAGRMKHDVRNGLYSVRTPLMRLKKLTATVSSESERQVLASEIASLEDGIRTIGRLLEFREDDDSYFTVNVRSLRPWLDTLHSKYGSTYRTIGKSIAGDIAVEASDYHLERIFWNIWRNAHSAVGEDCQVQIALSNLGDEVLILIADNGEGFTPEQSELMFKVSVATDPGRGRGLLEIQDSVRELRGSVEGVLIADGTYRMQIKLPRPK